MAKFIQSTHTIHKVHTQIQTQTESTHKQNTLSNGIHTQQTEYTHTYYTRNTYAKLHLHFVVFLLGADWRHLAENQSGKSAHTTAIVALSLALDGVGASA